MGYVLAVDAGGTTTRCAVADTACCCLGYGEAGPGNPISVGPEAASEAFARGIGAALAQAQVGGEQIERLLFCMAGGLTTDSLRQFGHRFEQLGIGVVPELDGDLLGNFCSATWESAGYLLEAGTGAGALRVEAGRIAQTADGLGWLVGDEGSGFWIGAQVARAAFAELDRRGPATALTALVMDQLNLDRSVDQEDGRLVDGRPAALLPALRHVYDMRPVELSRFARAAFQVPEDPVARHIVERAAAALANTLRAVMSSDVDGPVVLAGGVLTGNPGFAHQVTALTATDRPGAAFVTVEDGIVGAVVLALRRAGVQVGEDQFNAIANSLAALRPRSAQGVDRIGDRPQYGGSRSSGHGPTPSADGS